jgi:flagellar hook-associated protein 2
MLGVDGLASGIDTSSIVNSLMDVARTPIRAMEASIGRLGQRKSAMQEMNGLLADLQTALGAVDSASELGSFSATSSQPDNIGVTATGDVQPGMHTVRVYNLAENTVIRSSGMSSPTQQLRRGTLKLTIDGDTTNVPVQDADGTRTIEGLADYINSNVDGAHAYVLDTGTASNPYRLMIEGDEPGVENRVTHQMQYQGGPGKKLSPQTVRSGRDARLLIDNTTVYTASNTPTDLIPGLQLELKNTTSGNAQITTSRDSTAMADKVQTVVDAYNKLRDFVDKQSSAASPGPLSGDSTVRTVARRLQSLLTDDYSSGPLAGLNSLGISTAQDGKLEFDTSTFTAAAGNEFAATLDALTGVGGLFGAMESQLDLITDTTTGIIQPRLDSYDTQIDRLNGKIEDSQFRLEQYEDSLRMQFTAMESILAQYQATGDYLAAQLSALNNK